MANKLKILYYNGFHVGHYPHMAPYYKALGGLVYTTEVKAEKQLKQEYPGINVTTKQSEVIAYNPDVIMYADYNPMIKNLKGKNVMVFHAMENKGYMAVKRPWNYCEVFDLCLLYGNKIEQEFKDNGYNIKGKIIGYPRLDNIVKINKRIFNNDRKTILVAPTWGGLSLLTVFTEEVIKMSKKYNVIVKPHPATMEFRDDNKDKLQLLLESQSDTLKVFGNTDILPLMQYSDAMVTDVSGSANEFMFFNKPLIIADNGTVPIGTGKKPDIWKVFKVTDKPKDLISVVESQIKDDEMKEKRSAHFKEMVYTNNESTATERGISAIREVIENGSNN